MKQGWWVWTQELLIEIACGETQTFPSVYLLSEGASTEGPEQPLVGQPSSGAPGYIMHPPRTISPRATCSKASGAGKPYTIGTNAAPQWGQVATVVFIASHYWERFTASGDILEAMTTEPTDDIVDRVLSRAAEKTDRARVSVFSSGRAQALSDSSDVEHDRSFDGEQQDLADRISLRRVQGLSTELEDVTEV